MTLSLKIEREVKPTEVAYLIFGTGVFGWAPWWRDADIGNFDDNGLDFLPLEHPFETASEDSLIRIVHDDPNEPEGSAVFAVATFTMQEFLDRVSLAWPHLAAEAMRDMTEDLGLADAEAADIVMQYVVYDEIVFG